MKNDKLFLDDLRIPKDAIGLVPDKHNKFYWENDWNTLDLLAGFFCRGFNP